MQEITEAIKTKQAQIKSLEADVEALQRAALALGGKQATRRPKAKRKAKAKVRRTMSAAERKAVSQRMRSIGPSGGKPRSSPVVDLGVASR